MKIVIKTINEKKLLVPVGLFASDVSASQNSVLDNRKGPAKAGPLDYSCSKQLRM